MEVCSLSKNQIVQCRKQYERFGLEHLKAYCERRGIDFEEARRLVETGASNKAPVTTEISQESKIDGLYQDPINDKNNNIMFYYNSYPDEMSRMKRGFELDVITKTFFDITSDSLFKDPGKLLIRRGMDVLNAGLYDLKIEYANYLASIVNLGESKVDLINDKDALSQKINKLNLILSKAYQKIESWKIDHNSDYFKLLNTYVALKFFDTFLENIPYVAIDDQQHPFSKKRYIYKSDKVDHYTGLFSNDEDYAADKSYSKLTHMMLKYIPETKETSKGLEVVPGTAIGVDAFTSITQRFKEWLLKRRVEIRRKQDNIRDDVKPDANDEVILEELSKGSYCNYGRLMEIWASSSKISSLDKNKINTIAKLILGKKANGEFYTTDDVRLNFVHTINSTVKTAWLETVQELVKYDGHSRSKFTSRTLTERSSLLEKNNFTESIVANCIYWSRNKKAFEDLLKENPVDKEFDNDLDKREAELKFLGKLLNLDLLSWNQIETESAIVNGRADVEKIIVGLINNVISLSKTQWEKSEDSDLVKEVFEYVKNDADFQPFILNFSKILASLNHSSYKSVIKNAEGNNMPIFQLRSLSRLLMETWLSREDHSTPNAVSQNIENVDLVCTKSSSDLIDGKTAFPKLTFKETISQAIVSDFLFNLKNSQVNPNGTKEHRIFLQPHCYSDKKSSFPYGVRIDREWTFYEYDDDVYNPIKFYPDRVLNEIIDHNNENEYNKAVELIRKQWNAELWEKWNNILSDYHKAFDPQKKLDETKLIQVVDNFIKKHGVNEFVKYCYANGVKVIDGVHYVEKWKTTNKTINGLLRITNDHEFFMEYFNRKLNQFVDSLTSTDSGLSAWNIISQDAAVLETAKQWGEGWLENTPSLHNVDRQGGAPVLQSVKIEHEEKGINPIVKGFFIASNLFGESINRFLFGNYYGHDNKSKFDDITSLDKLELSISNHVLSQTKRNAVVGATYFPYDREDKYGVPKTMLMSVIKDEKAYVINTNGEVDNIDSKDGGGEVSPYMSRMANHSLHGAQVGHNKKTIWHFYNERYGTAGMLKWAEYEVTNAKRRSSYMAPTSYERLHKKMHSIPFSIEQKQNIVDNYRKWFGRKTLYYKDINTGNIVEIHGISLSILDNGDLSARIILNEDGYLGAEKIINNIYDMDQLLGGCWCQDVNPVTGSLTYAETNQDIIYKMICECDLKHCFLCYNSGVSGMKTGRTCVNPESSWHDDDPLMYFEVSTEFGGVQMDADHDIAESESTEPTQLIIHIGQDGTMSDEVRQIYELLQVDIMNSIAPYIEALENGDKDAIKQLVSKSIIEAFQTGDKDVISLAQTFVARALKNNGFDIPLSSDSINSKFVSTLMSGLSKKSTKRHYSGVGAVMNPSHNTMVYYDINGIKYKFEQVADIIIKANNDLTKQLGYEPTKNGFSLTINDWINEPLFDNGIQNPFMIKDVYTVDVITGITIESDPVEIGREYILWRYDNDGNVIDYEKIKINDLDDLLKHKHKYIGDPFVKITRNQMGASNLRGMDVNWTVSEGGIMYSVSQTENPYNLALLHLKDKRDLMPKSNTDIINEHPDLTSYLNDEAWNIIEKAKSVVGNNKDSIINYIRNQQKQWLNTTSEGKAFFHFGIIEDVKTQSTEIMIGKLYAKELGLLPGDNLYDIQDTSFFRSRISGYYDTTKNYDRESYDYLLFDGTGDDLYVVVGNPPQDHVVNDGFYTIDKTVYRNNRKICSSDGKTFVTYRDGNGVVHNYVYVDNIDHVNELMNSSKYVYKYTNIHDGNYNNFVTENKALIPNPEDSKRYSEYLENRNKDIEALKTQNNKSLKHFIDKEAQIKFDSFVKTLHFIGVRIPCQGMQSFSPLVAVGFVDVDTNEVYLPAKETWIEGADYDKLSVVVKLF